MIGLGTQDTLGEAEEFVKNYRTTSFTMLWDESFETWAAFGIASQPAALLFSADGRFVQGWMGPFPADQVISLATAS